MPLPQSESPTNPVGWRRVRQQSSRWDPGRNGMDYAFAKAAAREAGWEFGGRIAGHIVGEFPHAQLVPGDRDQHRIAPSNTRRIRDPDANGRERFWILEI